MSTLKQFSDKERDYHAYQARQNYLREQQSIAYRHEEARKAQIVMLINPSAPGNCQCSCRLDG